tara:strand:+ start:153 stop:506 length:354 start_codon:yes stop_codon:yes gene_type:complete
MAKSFTKQAFSGDTTGQGVLVAATATTGTTVHATSSDTTFDEVWIYATNNDASAINLTIEFGGTTATKVIKQSIPATSGLTIIVPGLILGPSKTVTAFAGTANKIVLFGYVNRVSGS